MPIKGLSWYMDRTKYWAGSARIDNYKTLRGPHMGGGGEVSEGTKIEALKAESGVTNC